MKKEILSEAAKGKHNVISEDNYIETMKQVVEPYLNGLRQVVILDRGATQKLYCEYYRLPEEGKGSVLISHGFSESCDKYREVIYYFLQEGYHVCTLDHRGHGRSRKDGEPMPAGRTTHVENFEFYIYDLNQVVQQVLCKELPGPYFLFGHSMGGAISVAYLEQFPGIFKKALLNAPMLEINTWGVPVPAVKAISAFNTHIGKAEEFLPGQGPYSAEENFEATACTCYPRYKYYFEIQRENPLFQNGGGSFGWTNTAYHTLDRILRPFNCQKVDIPVLLLQAEHDDFVLPGGQDLFISQILDGKLLFVPDVKHEIYLSGSDVLEDYWNVIFDFFALQKNKG